ncbi:MAG: hypothetical protein HKN23_05680, partial [Verrucomicrobiales bacterium]|nr:hypothetical protein [Verrucomicrobiales bacterium]
AVSDATRGIPWVNQSGGDYILCLLFFAVSVILYTTFGGFRAVVWTDVMQGLVMFAGVIILLILTLQQVGGLGNATKELAKMTPPEFGTAALHVENATQTGSEIKKGAWVRTADGKTMRLMDRAVIQPGETASEPVEVVILTTESDAAKVQAEIETGITARVTDSKEYAFGAGQEGVYLVPPGPHKSSPSGFLPVVLALSFFVFWNFSGAGQPSYMVRQMAYKSTVVLRRSIMMVAVYFTLIYFPLVLIFTSARVLIPGMEYAADRAMPEMAATVTSNAGMPWLAGLLVAAPFAAVMSSVDSFLLLVSSSIVRDIYQQSINPNATESRLKKLTYTVNIIVGVLIVFAVLNPPEFLQTLIIFASAGLGCFLMPMIFALYWKRATAGGIVAAMIAGAGTILVFYIIGKVVYDEFTAYELGGFHPFIWSMFVSAAVAIFFSLIGRQPDKTLVKKYFG